MSSGTTPKHDGLGTSAPRWGSGIAIGIAIGTAIGVAMGDIGVGIAIGAGLAVAFALAFGAAAKRRGNEDETPDPGQDE